MLVPDSGNRRLEDCTSRFLVQTMLGRRGRGAERLLEERDPHALGAADLNQRGGRPRLALHHFGKEGQADTNDFAIFGQAVDRLLEKRVGLGCRIAVLLREASECAPEGTQDFLGVIHVEEIDQADVAAFDQRDFQLSQEAADPQPEVVPHHHDALDPSAVTLPDRLNQLGVLFLAFAVEPLLELIQDDQYLRTQWNALSASQRGQRLFKVQVDGQRRAPFAQSVEQSAFGLPGG